MPSSTSSIYSNNDFQLEDLLSKVLDQQQAQTNLQVSNIQFKISTLSQDINKARTECFRIYQVINDLVNCVLELQLICNNIEENTTREAQKWYANYSIS
jgi:hypothetical protein